MISKCSSAILGFVISIVFIICFTIYIETRLCHSMPDWYHLHTCNLYNSPRCRYDRNTHSRLPLGYPAQRPVMHDTGNFYIVSLDKFMNKRLSDRWFEIPKSCLMWPHINGLTKTYRATFLLVGWFLVNDTKIVCLKVAIVYSFTLEVTLPVF